MVLLVLLPLSWAMGQTLAGIVGLCQPSRRTRKRSKHFVERLLPAWAIVLLSHADHVECGSASSPVQDQPKNARGIQATGHAFGASLGDVFVVTWGNAAHCGDSRDVQEQKSRKDRLLSQLIGRVHARVKRRLPFAKA